ncbi:MAG: hypothetical protein ACOX7H_06405 [Bacillota bacterium]|jgi:hypothetical protein
MKVIFDKAKIALEKQVELLSKDDIAPADQEQARENLYTLFYVITKCNEIKHELS